jgi:transcriptional regulator
MLSTGGWRRRQAAGMYRPVAFDVSDGDDLADMVRSADVAHLVTVGADGALDASLVPILFGTEPDTDGPLGTVRAHLARPNPQWRTAAAGTEVLLIVPGPDAYVSPSWYPSKYEHGRVVPTWNYELVHARGTLTVREDPEWLLALVTRLTERHEGRRATPWAVTDAPEAFIAAQLKGIVGVEIRLTGLEGKRKLSQNRSEQDRAGVIEALATGSPQDGTVARQMRRHAPAEPG